MVDGQEKVGEEGRFGEMVEYFDLKEVFGGPVDFFKGLLAGVGHGLHGEQEGRGGLVTVAL